MVEEEKIIGRSDVLVGFDSYVNSSSSNPNNEFFNFEQHNSASHSSDLFWSTKSSSPSKPAVMGDFCQFDDSSSLQRCVLVPCEPNERPSQGLSLSLSFTNPSTIGIQPFELVRNHHQPYFGKHINMHQHDDDDDMVNRDDDHQFLTKSAQQYNIRSSRYLVPAQHLLNEFCNLGTKQNDYSTKAKVQSHSQRTNNRWQNHDNLNNINATSSKTKPLNSLEFLELQKRKSKLLQMLEEVDRKYHNYCDQMKAVVSSFEAVAGNGAATAYSALASKAMSRHFRCLKDGIVGQIKATKMAMGEKDICAPGATRGETPRLRLLDQTLRHQRAFQQMTMMDSHPWRPQRGLPERSVSILRAWLFEHFLHPYPSDVDKHILARQTGLSRSQVSNWFINARVRLWKPMVEEMYMEETKENIDDENMDVSDRFDHDETTSIPQMEEKPTVDQLIQRDSECLSSIIINHHTTKTLDHDHFHQNLARVSADSFGAVELDFSAYNQSFGGGGVSLTLGLQQHADRDGGGGGASLFYPRDHMEDCQYSSLLEGDHQQGQNLPCRNLMGAQLLHDLAG